MKDLLAHLAHLLQTIAGIPEPCGARPIVADSLPKKQKILAINRPPQLVHTSPKVPTHGILPPTSL
jgi:hypothetical protein